MRRNPWSTIIAIVVFIVALIVAWWLVGFLFNVAWFIVKAFFALVVAIVLAGVVYVVASRARSSD
jgi:uncharacterized protein YacL